MASVVPDSADIDALTAAAAGGERRALEALLVHYLPQVRAFVRLRTGEAMSFCDGVCDPG